MNNIKTLTMVNYKDYLLIQLDKKTNKPIETQVIPSRLYFEYIDGVIDNKGLSELINPKIRENCVADIVMIEVYQLQVPENNFNALFNMMGGNKKEVIKEYFRTNMFNEEPNVVQVGTFLHNPRGINYTGLYS